MLALIASLTLVVLLLGPPVAAQDTSKPNILVIFGDDIGQTNVSAYSFDAYGVRYLKLQTSVNPGKGTTTLPPPPAPVAAARPCPRAGSWSADRRLHRGDGGLPCGWWF